MMKTNILIIAFTLAGLVGMAQTNQPLPSGAVPFGATTYLSPLDSTIWLYKERDGTAIKVANWVDVYSLFGLGYTKGQADSAITAQIGGINFPVTSVNSMTGDVVLAPNDLGLGNVDNTSDLNKPISTATQGALDGKENAFSKGSLVAGANVTLSGTLVNRLVGSGNVTVNATPADLSNYVQKTGDTMTGPLTVSGSTGSETFKVERTGGSGGSIMFGKGGSGTPLFMVVTSLGGGTQFNFSGASSWNFDTNIAAPNLVTFNRTTNGFVPAPGGSGTTRFLREDMTWGVPSGGGGGGTATDLSIQNRTASSLDIGSSTGTAATVPARTSTLAGLMLPADLAAINASTQTLSLGDGGVLSISGGNSATIYSLGRVNANDFDLFDPPSGIYSIVNGSGSTGYPAISGAGLYIKRNTGNTTGSYALYGGNDNTENIYINTGNGGGHNGWQTLWHSGNFSPSDYVSASSFTWGNLSGKPSTFTPSPHTHNASDIDAGTLAAARIGNATVSNAKLSNMTANTIKGRSGTTGAPQDLTAAQVRSLINVANGATANSTDAFLLNRANHTGTQAINTISGLQSELDGLVPTNGSGTSSVSQYGGDYNDLYTSIVYASSSATNAPDLGHTLTMRVNSSLSAQLHANATGDDWLVRKIVSGTPTPWRTLWHSGNFSPSNYAQLGTGSTQVRNNSQLDTRYLQSVSGGSGINVTGGSTIAVDNTVIRSTGNQTVGGTKTFSSPVVVANATNSNHAVTLGQVNSLVPESPDWTQYGTEFVTQDRPVIYPSGYFPIGSLSSLGVPYWANVLANSFVNVGDMVEVDGIVEITTNGSAGTNNAQIRLLGSTFTLRSGDPNIYDINVRFRYDGGTSVSYVIKVSSMLGANQAPYLDIFRGTASMSLSNNILVSVWVNTSTSGANRPVNVHEVRVTKYSAKFSN